MEAQARVVMAAASARLAYNKNIEKMSEFAHTSVRMTLLGSRITLDKLPFLVFLIWVARRSLHFKYTVKFYAVQSSGELRFLRFGDPCDCLGYSEVRSRC